MGIALVWSEKRRVKNAKPVAGMCSACGAGACVVEVHAQRRLFLLIPLYSRTWRAIVCPSCGALLKSYKCFSSSENVIHRSAFCSYINLEALY
ncbi:uncharacterized protein LOC131065236 isoform X2 [Cryptomeria japonica]|uniref:uncharacterized protein LOC131065236 isoform X2 n=1 Tax=Cryptomeria japonica TaxID=3369 RepID=UPI0027DA0574|nr:uncharacterized protein LOC131065236 isoform X2 [Cryptomeria japonica]